MDDVDSRDLARSTGIEPCYCEAFRSAIRRFFWNDNQVMQYPLDGGTAIAVFVPGYICELYDTGSHVQISLYPPADPAATRWILVIAGSVKDDATLPDGAEVVEAEALQDRLCQQLRPVWDAHLSSAWHYSTTAG